MCGRYNLRATPAEIQQFFDVLRVPDLPPRYNVAPTQAMPVVRAGDEHTECVLARWGLIPSWASDPGIGARMINARSETVAEKPSFRAAFKRRRCLVPASGYYEWQKVSGEKQPYHIHRPDDGLFAFAGLWERWSKGSEPLESFTIITTAAPPDLARLHDRMPVILPREQYALWLDLEVEPAALLELLQTPAAAGLEASAVDRLVGNVKNDTPECIAPLKGE